MTSPGTRHVFALQSAHLLGRLQPFLQRHRGSPQWKPRDPRDPKCGVNTWEKYDDIVLKPMDIVFGGDRCRAIVCYSYI